MNTGVYVGDRDMINASAAGRVSVRSAILTDIREYMQESQFKCHNLWNKLQLSSWVLRSQSQAWTLVFQKSQLFSLKNSECWNAMLACRENLEKKKKSRRNVEYLYGDIIYMIYNVEYICGHITVLMLWFFLIQSQGHLICTFAITSDSLWCKTGRKLERSFIHVESCCYQTIFLKLKKYPYLCFLLSCDWMEIQVFMLSKY